MNLKFYKDSIFLLNKNSLIKTHENDINNAKVLSNNLSLKSDVSSLFFYNKIIYTSI